MTIHVTNIRDGGVYGHETAHCDEAGCAEHFFKDVSPAEVQRGHVYEIDDNGAVIADVTEGDY